MILRSSERGAKDAGFVLPFVRRRLWQITIWECPLSKSLINASAAVFVSFTVLISPLQSRSAHLVHEGDT